MNKSYMLGFPIYKFYYPDNKVEQIKQETLKLKWSENPLGSPQNLIWEGVYDHHNLHDLPQFNELFNWFHECLEQVKIDLNLTCDSLKVVSSWANLNKKGDSFHDHRHPNCFMGSNYYVSGDETTGTVWHIENPYFNNNIYPLGQQEDTHIYYYEPTEPGKFIIFPPTIYHYSTPNYSDQERITIAANIFPEGNITWFGTSKIKITLG